jgi:hypothetical protein
MKTKVTTIAHQLSKPMKKENHGPLFLHLHLHARPLKFARAVNVKRSGLWLFIVAGIYWPGCAQAAPAASPGGSHHVNVSESGDRVTLNTGALVLQLELAPDGAVLLQSLKLAHSDYDWAMKNSPVGINLSSDQVNLTGFSAGKGFQQAGHSHKTAPDGGTELQIKLEHPLTKLVATFIITAYPDSPVVDLCLRLKNAGDAPFRNVSRFASVGGTAEPGESVPRSLGNPQFVRPAPGRGEGFIDGGWW